MGYELDGLGSIPGNAKCFFSPQLPDLSNGYRGLFPCGEGGKGVKLTTHLQLVPRSRMVELYLRSPICLHGIVLN
jgi:hypothetical protein